MHDCDLGPLNFCRLIALIRICKVQTMWIINEYANDFVYIDVVA